VFCARYRCAAAGFDVLEQVALATPSDLAARLDGRDETVTLVGDGAVRHRSVLEGASRSVRDDLVVPSPGAALRLTDRRATSGALPVPHTEVHPWYLREADAVANFAVREAGP
jgi:hypothetical protein